MPGYNIRADYSQSLAQRRCWSAVVRSPSALPMLARLPLQPKPSFQISILQSSLRNLPRGRFRREFERVGSSRTLHANVRIISASNANLHDEVSAGRFRQDLLFRLNTIEIALPS